MKIDPVVVQFLDDICEKFPEMRLRMEKHDDFMTTSRMEEFAQATTEGFGRGDARRAMEYLSFMSKRLNVNNKREYEFIDVYYVENLFWPHRSEAARAGWPFVPENLKKLFLAFHGRPPV